MTKPLRILAPLGGDAAGLAALIFPLAAAGPVELTLLRVGDRESLARAERSFRSRGLSFRPLHAEGDPAGEILGWANSRRFDLVTMLTHGRRGLPRLLFGSVTEAVLRGLRIPLLLARPGTGTAPRADVVAALDGSVRAERVLARAGVLAKAAGTPLRLLRVHGPGGAREAGAYLARTCARLERRGIAALPVLLRGSPAAAILRYAKAVQCGVLALTTRGRTGLRRLLLGSVAEAVIRRAPCPVLVAPG